MRHRLLAEETPAEQVWVQSARKRARDAVLALQQRIPDLIVDEGRKSLFSVPFSATPLMSKCRGCTRKSYLSFSHLHALHQT